MLTVKITKIYDEIWARKLKESRKVETGSRMDIASKLVGSGDRLLDIGCGNGSFATLVKDRYKEIYGVDLSREALRRAQELSIRAVKANLNLGLPFKDNCFDAVICLDVIEHIFDPRKFTAELSRVIKKGGILIISSPNIQYWKHVISIIAGRFPKTSDDEEAYDGGHLHYFTFKDLEKLLEKNKLRVIKKAGVFDIKFLKIYRSMGIVIKARRLI
ncbi:MAG: class I SAM-dependent methyltransferase [Thermoplasmatales archaeon]|nr:class I SAM-dependent methyltransferase [Thermoplasmatales archaeon]